MHRFLPVLLASGFLMAAGALLAQTSTPLKVSDLKITAGVQFVGIYTTNSKADLNGDQALEPVDDRFDFSVRRGRLGVSGTVADTLDFRVVLAYDNLGKEPFTGTRSSPNEVSVILWDAYGLWRPSRKWANVTFGFFRPQIGRESITAAFQINSSMDKLPTQTYTRLHTVGRSSGREGGVNVGALWNRRKWGLSYNVGLFDPSHEKIIGAGASGGSRWSPLVTGRVALSLGDPEMDKYGIDYRVNYFGKRKGVTAAAAAARHGETNLFLGNQMYSFDLLGNYAHWNLSGELDLMRRTPLSRLTYTDRVWHVRSGYNIPARSTYLEPVVAVMRFTGDANSPFKNGRDRLVEAGLNWYVKETRVKLNVHCTRQHAAGVSLLSDGKTFLKGNMVGFGVQFLY